MTEPTAAAAHPRRRRLAVLLLLFFVGGAAGVVTAITLRDTRPARPSADGEQPGTGTVIGGTEPTPSPSAGEAPGEAEATPSPTGPADPGPSGGIVGPAPGATAEPGDTTTPPSLGVFHIAGDAPGLVPGRKATLVLRVTNPNPWPIRVLTIDTRVVERSMPGCPTGLLTVAAYRYATGEPFSAPAFGRVEVPVAIELADSRTQDQSGCAGVTFPLTMTGTAARVG